MSIALKTTTTLRGLYLDTNNIDLRGVLSISRSLITNTSLEVVDMDMNDQGSHVLSQVLEINTSIQNLSLHENILRTIRSRILNLMMINAYLHRYRQEYQEKLRKQRIYHNLVV